MFIMGLTAKAISVCFHGAALAYRIHTQRGGSDGRSIPMTSLWKIFVREAFLVATKRLFMRVCPSIRPWRFHFIFFSPFVIVRSSDFTDNVKMFRFTCSLLNSLVSARFNFSLMSNVTNLLISDFIISTFLQRLWFAEDDTYHWTSGQQSKLSKSLEEKRLSGDKIRK